MFSWFFRSYFDKLPAIISAAKGAVFIEKHFTLSKKLSSDAKFAMEPSEFKDYIKSIKRTWILLATKLIKTT